VIAGAVLGALIGGTWFAAMRATGRAGWFGALAAWWPLKEWLLAKDTWDCAEPLLAEQGVDYKGGWVAAKEHGRGVSSSGSKRE